MPCSDQLSQGLNCEAQLYVSVMKLGVVSSSVRKSIKIAEIYNIQIAKMSREGSSLSLVVQESGESQRLCPQKANIYIPGEKSGRWSLEEHMKYIAFIDFNRDRMRCRDKRRSNKFYQEMSDFIITRNALQCRSHHQKLQEKYSKPQKIVNFFKPTFDRSAYREALDFLQAMQRQGASEKSAILVIPEIAKRSFETQTDIGGRDLEFVSVSPNCYIIQTNAYRCQPSAQPAYCYHPFIINTHVPATTNTLPSAEGIVSAVTWDSHTFTHDFGGHSL